MKEEYDKWIVKYDKEVDSLFIGQYPQPSDARLFHATEGFAYYLNEKNEITGIFIEYFETMKNREEPKEKIKDYHWEHGNFDGKCDVCGGEVKHRLFDDYSADAIAMKSRCDEHYNKNTQKRALRRSKSRAKKHTT